MYTFFHGWRRKTGLVWLVVAFLSLFGWWTYVDFTQLEVGENVPSVSWLPAAASNVSFYKSYSYTAYEFDIAEPAFVKWSRWKLTPITHPVQVWRYCFFAVSKLPSPSPSATDDEWKAFETISSTATATIDDGLYYDYRQSNGGGVHVAYDRNRGRAFVQSSPR